MRVVSENPRIVLIDARDIAECPRQSLIPEHYRNDGTCKCYPDPPEGNDERADDTD